MKRLTGCAILTGLLLIGMPSPANGCGILAEQIKVTKSGTGSGTVTSTAGIYCGTSCTVCVPFGTPVSLLATASSGSSFAGWKAGCNVVGPTCTFLGVLSDQNVEAIFNANTQTLSVTKVGQAAGTIDSSPAGINCPGTCSASFSGTVTLNAHPGTGATFMGWSGSCSGTGACSVSMTAARSVTATFGYALSVSKPGVGLGTVTSSDSGINCGIDCSQSYATATSVTLHATPSAGSAFAGWSGACSGTADCTLSVSSAKAVSALFGYLLTVTRNGSGTGRVTESTATISCPSICSAVLVPASSYVLMPSPDPGSTFSGWSGACTGTAFCTITNSAGKGPQSVTATFTSTTPNTLTVFKNGSGTGTITSAPAGINCGAVCSAPFPLNSQVTLTASPAAGSSFDGWSGDCSGTGLCTVAMGGSHSVGAFFSTVQQQPTLYRLTVVKAGTGSGTVTSNPAGLSCGTACTANFNQGTLVTLTAAADAGSSFSGWDPPCTGTGVCTVAMAADSTITARFNSTAFCAPTIHAITVSPSQPLPGQSFTLSVDATTPTGSLSYEWYRGSIGDTSGGLIGTTQSITVSQTAKTSYWVRVSSSCGSSAISTGSLMVNLNTGTCGDEADQLCINNARYRVTLLANDGTGKSTTGIATYQSNVFGYFALPTFTGNPTSPEVFVKVVGPVNGVPWVFYAGLTNVDYTISVYDTFTSKLFNTYHVATPSSAGLSPFQSIGNFDVAGATSTKCANVNVTTAQVTAVPGTCALNPCLLNRFKVTLAAADNPTRSTNTGQGLALPVNQFFYFFATPTLSDPNDIQAFLKMVDATSFDGHYWVFLGGLTDFTLTFTVTDTTTGRQKIYEKPAGSTCGWNDTAAFP